MDSKEILQAYGRIPGFCKTTTEALKESWVSDYDLKAPYTPRAVSSQTHVRRHLDT